MVQKRNTVSNKRVDVGLSSRGGVARYADAFARFERDYAARILRVTKGNMTEGAELAGVNRVTLYRMCWKHGLLDKAA